MLFLHELKQVLVLVKQFTSAPSVETFILNRYYTHGSSFFHSVVCKLRNTAKEFGRGSLLYVNTIQYIIASGAERGELPPGKLNVKTGLPLNLYFHLTLFWFSVGYCFVYFSDYFPVLRFLV